jgi:hypothetical protein
MRKVDVSHNVREQLDDLALYMVNEFKLSEQAAMIRIGRFAEFMFSLSSEVDHPRCRFKRWRRLGYRCAVFEKNWVLAYEVFDSGIIVRDMSHAKLLTA